MIEEGTRINKYLSAAGFCSRREADKLVEAGRVTVSGEKASMGVRVTEMDEIRVDGKLVSEKMTEHVYLAFNKPRGVVCTTKDPKEENTIIKYIDYPTRIYPIGRLDKASEGLIFLTDDGDIVNRINRARNKHEKEYIVTVDKPVTKEFIRGMSKGVPILDTVTRECEVEQVGQLTFRIILTQGLNRQIRRMCEHFDYRVRRLQRIRIMNVGLDHLPTGKWRNLTRSELKEMKRMLKSD